MAEDRKLYVTAKLCIPSKYIISLLILFSFVGNYKAQLTRRFQAQYSWSPEGRDGDLQRMVIHKETGQLYIGGTDYLYHTTSELHLIAEQSSVTAGNTQSCTESSETCTSIPLEYGNKNRILLISYNRSVNFVVACGSSYLGSCVLHDPRDINRVHSRVLDENNRSLSSIAIGESVVAFFGSIRGGEQGIYIGSTFLEQLPRNIVQHSVSTRKLFLNRDGETPKWTFLYGYAESKLNRYTYIDVLEEYRSWYKIDYVHGFGRQDYSYFLTVQRQDLYASRYHTRIVRICTQDKAYYSYTEMPLECKSANNQIKYNILKAAYVGTVGSKLASELNIDSNDEVIFGVFAKSVNESTKAPSSESAVCLFPMKTISRRFIRGLQDCFDGYGNQGLRFMSDDTSCRYVIVRTITEDFCGTGDINPVESHTTVSTVDFLNGGGHGHDFTSIAVKPQDSDTILVMGTQGGSVLKFILEPRVVEGVRREYPLMPYKVLYLDTPGPVLSDMMFDSQQNNIYTMTSKKVYLIEMNTCAHYTHCSACILTHDPNGCGWCSGSCMTQTECVALGRGHQWNQTTCSPVIFEVIPTSAPLTGGTVVSIIGDNLGHKIGNGSHSVTLAGEPCDIDESQSNLYKFVCITRPVSEALSGPAVVQVETRGSEFNVTGNAVSPEEFHFSFVEPKIESFSPKNGPISGGTMINIRGTGLNAGNTQEITVARVPCFVTSIGETFINCITNGTSDLSSGVVDIAFDSFDVRTEDEFTFAADPYISSFTPNKSIISGGLTILVTGLNLHLAKPLQVKFEVENEDMIAHTLTEICRLESSVRATCKSPDIRQSEINPSLFRPAVANVSFNLGIMQLPLKMLVQENMFYFFPDPVVNSFDGSAIQEYKVGDKITIKGENLNILPGIVMPFVSVAGEECEVISVTSNFIRCKLPYVRGSANDEYFVKIQFGGNLVYEVGWVKVTQSFPVILLVVVVMIICITLTILFLIVISRKRSKALVYQTATTEVLDVEYVPNSDDTTENGGGTLRIANTPANAYLRHPSNQGTPELIIGGASVGESRPLLEYISKDVQMMIGEVLVQEDNLTLGDIIGRGQYGCVYEGRYFQDGKEIKVAAKSLLRGDGSEVSAFLKEGIIMKDFDHPNVLELVGVCLTRENQPLVLLPFMKNGDLLSYIRNANNELTGRELLNFSRQIAEGMSYLSSLKFVHRDLAARNCMLDDRLVVKVADFGLSRDMYEKDYYSSKDKTVKLPIRWMALECLERNVYSIKTDVWSYGVVMWELLTRGMTPYSTVDNWDLLAFLQRGRRLPQPDHCPDHVYQIMLNCWSASPVDRPMFDSLAEQLSSILESKEHMKKLNEYDMTYINVQSL